MKAMKYISYLYLIIFISACNNSNNNNPKHELTDNKEINSNNKSTNSSTTKSNKKLNSQERFKYYNSLADSLLNDSTLYFNDKNKWLDSLITLSLSQFSIQPRKILNCAIVYKRLFSK